MAIAVVMPRQGQSVESCVITQWHKSKGDDVTEGDLLFSYETDKAAFDEEAQDGGVLLDIFFDEGDEVPVLENVAVIGQPGENYDDLVPAALSATGEKSPVTGSFDKDNKQEEVPAGESPGIVEEDKRDKEQAVSSGDDSNVRISPRAKKVAGEHNISTDSINGSGAKGRIIEKDIRDAIEKLQSKPDVEEVAEKISVAAVQKSSESYLKEGDDYTVKKISNMRRIISEKMHESLSNSAQLTHHMSADARKLLAKRKEIKATSESPGVINININAMVCYALVKALKDHPGVNAHFLGDSVKSFNKVHLGIAVDTERGLMVPVVRYADEMNISILAKRIKSLAESCKKGNIDPELLASEAASFSVSNLGAYGVEMFTPVLNLPQVGILGVNTITYRPADLGNGVIGFIPVIGISLTYDHRAIDGAPASAFLKAVKDQIENIEFDV